MDNKLERFVQAQESSYTQALSEIVNGKKTGHWIWYVFPQLKGLGRSSNSDYYGIENANEAVEYLNHPILGPRLREITLSILTVNYNGLSDTLELIESLYTHLQDIEYEIIVVDNGSKVDESIAIRDKHPQVVTIRSEKNLGFAGGNNLGLTRARGKYVYLINNDTIITDDSVKNLIHTLEEKPDVGLVCPKILYMDDRKIQFAGYTPMSKITIRNKVIGNGMDDDGSYDSPSYSAFAHGAAMLIKKELLAKAGLIPTMYFLYYEELDWSLRIKEAGYNIYYEPNSSILHKESRTTGKGSPLREYYISRNKLVFAYRNRKGGARLLSLSYILLIAYSIRLIKALVRGNFDHAKARLNGIKDFFKFKKEGKWTK